MPSEGDSQDDDVLDDVEDDEAPEDADADVVDNDTDDVIHPDTSQRLVRLPRRRPPLPTPDPPEPPEPPEPHAARAAPPRAPPRRRRPTAPANTTPAAPPTPPTQPNTIPTVTSAPLPAPAITTLPATPSVADGNVFLAFEETLKLFPAAAHTIAVERKTGTPAHWMITERPRTANELYAAIRRLHGRSAEATYAVTFRDGGGHGGAGQVSMPSTLDELPAPPAAAVQYPAHQPAPVAYAQSAQPTPVVLQPAPTGAPFDANTLLTMQRQLFEMMQSMQSPKQQPVAPMAIMPTAPPPPPPTQTAPDVNSLLAMQKQMFDMMQAMQATAAGNVPPSPPPAPAPAPVQPPSQSPSDQATTLLSMQRQMFEMMQAMQATAAGHAPQPPAPPAPAAPAVDSTGTMLAMQKQMFDMMLTMMQTAQRGAAPQPSGGAYTGPYRPRDPRDGGMSGAPSPAYASPHYQPPQRPQTPSEQLRDAVSVMRSTFEVAREFQDFVGSPAAEPTHQEDDDSPVRVIDMGPAKGVINRNDGSLRGVETFMANLPDIIKFVGETGSAIRKARDEDRQKQQKQQQLPPGYVVAGPDYRPPEGFVAVPVDQIPQTVEEPLPEAPDEMPPPIASEPKPRPRPAWGMPPTRQG